MPTIISTAAAAAMTHNSRINQHENRIFMRYFFSLPKCHLLLLCRSDENQHEKCLVGKKVPLNNLTHIMRCHMTHTHFQFVLFDSCVCFFLCLSFVFIYFDVDAIVPCFVRLESFALFDWKNGSGVKMKERVSCCDVLPSDNIHIYIVLNPAV